MSRGLGIRERSILAALREHPAIWFADLVPAGPRHKSEYQALYRAARTLCDKGQVEVWADKPGLSPIVLARPEIELGDLRDVPHLPFRG